MAKQKFGSAWTEVKLDCVNRYLERYNTALKNTPFQRVYVDAFAGTGYVEIKSSVKAQDLRSVLTEGERTSRKFIDGSARLALETQPPFHRFVFIEKCQERAKELERLRSLYRHRAVSIVNGDANSVLSELCQQRWTSQRAVLFLDPFGLSVEWATLEAIAGTQAIDMWYLFPLMGLNRQLRKDGLLPSQTRDRVSRLLGCTEWQDAFYETRIEHSLFGAYEMTERAVDFEGLSNFLVQRLERIFAGVAPNPLLLTTQNNTALFLLCFAAGNPKGAPIAVRIAKSILENA